MKPRPLRHLLPLILVAGLSACGLPQKLSVYKIDIPQGNQLRLEDVEQLRKGMNQQQVIYLLGSPLLTDAFSPDRWDYVYLNHHGSGKITRHRLVLYFEEELLARFEHDLEAEEKPEDQEEGEQPASTAAAPDTSAK